MSRRRNNNSEISNALNKVVLSYIQGQHKYINEFIEQYKSATDLLSLNIYPNAKEITESYAAFNCARTKIRHPFSDPTYTVVCVGDGRTPRTAALFAFRSNWRCISIDPILDTAKIPMWISKIRHLECIPKRVEDVDLMFEKVLIVCVHSHAPLDRILEHIRGKVRSLIAIPCCVSYEYDRSPCKEYFDAGIWSPMNLVKYWKVI